MARILVVDDDRPALLYVSALLGAYSDVACAGNGSDAVARFTSALEQGEPFDAVVMDIMMPGMDGMEAVRRMRGMEAERGIAEESRTRVIMLSCLHDQEHLLAAQYEAGADAYLTKPAEPSAILEILSNLGVPLQKRPKPIP